MFVQVYYVLRWVLCWVYGCVVIVEVVVVFVWVSIFWCWQLGWWVFGDEFVVFGFVVKLIMVVGVVVFEVEIYFVVEVEQFIFWWM